MTEDSENQPTEKLEKGLDIEAVDDLRREIQTSSMEVRKECARTLKREFAEGVSADTVEQLTPLLEIFLSDPERPVRLTAVKGVVETASVSPSSVKPLADTLDDLLYDEFYFVRGRAAEALGYLVHEYPDADVSPTVAVSLLDALSLDEAEVRQKAAKAVSMLACSRPDALLHHTDELVDHADETDDNPVTRYHLLTTLAALALDSPSEIEPYVSEIEAFLDDESPFVRGRAVETLGILGRNDFELQDHEYRTDEAESFESERVEWALRDSDELVEDLHAETDETVRNLEREASDSVLCPNCEEPVPPDAPMCPRCGVPHDF